MVRRWRGASRRARTLIALIVGVNLLILGAAAYVVAQGPYAFTPNSIAPTQDAAYDLGAPSNRFRNLYFSGTLAQSGTGGLTVGANGTALTQIRIATASFAPTAMAAISPSGVLTSAEQAFTVSWLTFGDKVFVNGPAPTASCPMISARVSATASLSLGFSQLTSALCTPASGTYTVTAIRSAVSVNGAAAF